MKITIRPEDFLIDDLFEDSSFFLEEARRHDRKDRRKARRYIRASIITAFAALDALLNAMLTVLDATEDLEVAERAFVQEKRVELAEDGYFEIKGQQFRSVEQKIRFLHWRTAGAGIPEANAVWSSFIDATKLRNKLVHPRPRQVSYSGLTVSAAESCLIAVSKVALMLGYELNL